jgi:RND family efflux transporter MFP subunit
VNTRAITYKALRFMIIVISLMAILFLSCQNNSINGKAIAVVKEGTIVSSVNIRGKLEMPREVKLHFGTAGTIKKIFVTNGSKVKAGTLLAKLDDTAQTLAVAQAQYNVELALNEIVEKVHGSILGVPNYYPSTSTILGVEQALDEVQRAQGLLSLADYTAVMTELRLASHDLKASYTLLQPPEGLSSEDYPDIFRAISLLETDINLLEQNDGAPLGVQVLLERGQYAEASTALTTLREKLEETQRIVEGVAGMVKSYAPPFPDTSTSLDTLKQAKESLEEVQKLTQQDNYDAVKVAEMLRMAQHDLDLSNMILEKSELLFKQGLNLKLFRMNNLNVQKADKALESAKVELMKTELIAPFDGIVVDVPVKENDQLSAVDYTSKTIAELVDTTNIEFDGTVDEVDMSRIVDKKDADIYVDVLPNDKFTGKIIFVSPYGNLTSGTASYLVQIRLDPPYKPLQRGLSTTASIFVGERDNVLLIPNNAVQGLPGSYWVNVVTDERSGLIEKRSITLGLENDDYVEVISGLHDGDRVLVQTLHR